MKTFNSHNWRNFFKEEHYLTKEDSLLDGRRDLFLDILWIKALTAEDDDCIPANDIDYLYREHYPRPVPFKRK